MILLDTHVVLWLALDPSRISQTAMTAIEDARAAGGLAISPVTFFEVAGLVERGRVQLTTPCEWLLRDIANRFVSIPVSVETALVAARLTEPYPKDPMDRLIGATAIVEGMPLVTADERIQQSGQLQTIW